MSVTFSQLLFLAGTSMVIGVKNTGGFFFQRSKARGTSLFLFGILLVICKWPKIGFFIEAFGFVNLFGCDASPLLLQLCVIRSCSNFFPQVVPFLRAVPGFNKLLDIPAVHAVLVNHACNLELLMVLAGARATEPVSEQGGGESSNCVICNTPLPFTSAFSSQTCCSSADIGVVKVL